MNESADKPCATVLVVDDDLLVREYAADVLESEGFDVLKAANAAEALDQLGRRGDIRVLFTDVNMPGPLDGLELAHVVRRRWPDIRVVVTSGRLQPEARALPGPFLPKPYLPEMVVRLLKAMLPRPGLIA